MVASPNVSPLDARLQASYAAFLAERPPGADEDVHYLETIVDHVIQRCTRPGGLVLDPFAGFGTTVHRAVALGRRAIGVELMPERVDYIRRHAPGATVIEGDARALVQLLADAMPTEQVRTAGQVDLVLTSPPYMTVTHHEADPLTAYEEDGGDYARYLRELGVVAAHCAHLVRPGGFVVWNVADIHHRGTTTELVADCARVLAAYLKQVSVTPIVWDRLPHDLVADALLVFQREVPDR